MEQKSQSLERILDSIAPTLSDAVERIVQETREKQEEEFQKRLETAVRDAEESVRQMAQTQLDQAVGEAREEVRSQVAAELKSQFDASLEWTTAQLQAQFDGHMKSTEALWEQERAKLRDEVDSWRVFAEAQRELSDSRSQVDMLMRFMNLVQPFAGSIAVYVMKADGLALWKTRGSTAFPDLVSHNTIDPDSYFKPIIVRDKTVAAVCAHAPYNLDPLDFLVASLARAIEVFGMKLQTPAPRHSSVEVAHNS
jgi:hypothetical protein